MDMFRSVLASEAVAPQPQWVHKNGRILGAKHETEASYPASTGHCLPARLTAQLPYTAYPEKGGECCSAEIDRTIKAALRSCVIHTLCGTCRSDQSARPVAHEPCVTRRALRLAGASRNIHTQDIEQVEPTGYRRDEIWKRKSRRFLVVQG